MNYSEINKIFDSIKEYVTDSKSEGAVYINGRWGVGKTYFVFNKLKPMLEELNVDYTNNSNMFKEYALFKHISQKYRVVLFNKRIDRKYKVIGISLNGIKSCEELNKLLINATVRYKKKKTFSKFSSNSVEITSKLISGIAGIAGINLEVFPKVEEFFSINNSILIFDDLERCQIDIATLLGYIDSFSEYDNIRVIVIGNEEKLLKNHNNDDEPDNDTDPSKNQGRNDIFKNIKEKVFFLQIEFCPRIEDIFSEILEEYNDIESYRLFLSRNRVVLIEYLKKNVFDNLRTILFALRKFKKIFLFIEKKESELYIIDEVVNKNKYNESQLRILLQYLSDSMLSRENKVVQTCNIKYEDGSVKACALECVKTHINSSFFDENTCLCELRGFFIAEHYRITQFLKNKHDGLYKLEYWYELKSEAEINRYLEQVYSNLQKEGYYSLDECLNFLISYTNMEKEKIVEETKIKPFLKKIKEIFSDKSDLNVQEQKILLNRMNTEIQMWEMNNTSNSKCCSYYREILEEVFNKNNKKLLEKIENEWQNGLTEFIEFCNQNIEKIKEDNAFISKIDIQKLFDSILKSSNTELYNLRKCLDLIYSNRTAESYCRDLKSMEQFVELIKKESFSDKLKNWNLNCLKNELEKIIYFGVTFKGDK